MFRSVNKQRDVVVGHRQIFLTGAACSVIGDEDEQRVLEPGFFPHLGKELANGVVGILHRSFATVTGRYVDATFRVGIGSMI